MRVPLRRLGLLAAVLLAAAPARAQAPPVGWPTGSTTAPVVLVPASAINGAGQASVAIRVPDGAAGTPGLTFTTQQNIGLYYSGSNQFCTTAAGSATLCFNTNANTAQNGIGLGFAAGTGVADTVFWRLGAASLALGNGTGSDFSGTLKLTTLLAQAGSAGTPAVQFAAGPGLYSASGNLFFSIASTNIAQVDANGITVNASSGRLSFSSASLLQSSADKLLQIKDSAAATGTEFNNGTPTLGACTGGTMTSGSHNIAGEVTGNTSGSCVINFGTPNFTNTPFCFANDETTLTAVRISARSASSITVTGAVSGDAFQFFCIGRIGT